MHRVPWPLVWRHNESDSVSNHRRLDCLLGRFIKINRQMYFHVMTSSWQILTCANPNVFSGHADSGVFTQFCETTRVAGRMVRIASARVGLGVFCKNWAPSLKIYIGNKVNEHLTSVLRNISAFSVIIWGGGNVSNCFVEDKDLFIYFANTMTVDHDDVIKWKHFPRYWPLWGEFTGHRASMVTGSSFINKYQDCSFCCQITLTICLILVAVGCVTFLKRLWVFIMSWMSLFDIPYINPSLLFSICANSSRFSSRILRSPVSALETRYRSVSPNEFRIAKMRNTNITQCIAKAMVSAFEVIHWVLHRRNSMSDYLSAPVKLFDDCYIPDEH